jgi:hypothetical protein
LKKGERRDPSLEIDRCVTHADRNGNVDAVTLKLSRVGDGDGQGCGVLRQIVPYDALQKRRGRMILRGLMTVPCPQAPRRKMIATDECVILGSILGPMLEMKTNATFWRRNADNKTGRKMFFVTIVARPLLWYRGVIQVPHVHVDVKHNVLRHASSLVPKFAGTGYPVGHHFRLIFDQWNEVIS